jgi:deoxyguanosine kinase
MLISIEGNIGTGKSSLVKLLEEKYKSNPDIVFIQEPVQEWINLKDTDGENILEKFYKQQDRWSYTFQMHAFITRAKAIQQQAYNKSLIIIDRSVLTDHYVFAKLLYQDKKISKLEWELYIEWFDWLTAEFKSIIPDYYIYLKADPAVSFKRIQQRTRSEESTIPFEYIERVSNKHDEWLLSDKINNKKIILANQDFIHNIDNQRIMIDSVSEIIDYNIDRIPSSGSERSLDELVSIASC